MSADRAMHVPTVIDPNMLINHVEFNVNNASSSSAAAATSS